MADGWLVMSRDVCNKAASSKGQSDPVVGGDGMSNSLNILFVNLTDRSDGGLMYRDHFRGGACGRQEVCQ